MTALTATADQIRAGALEYNREYPEAAADVAAGEPQVLVIVSGEDAYGRRVRVVIAPIVQSPGGDVYAADPVCHVINRGDGRITKRAAAERNSKRLGLTGVQVPIRFIEHL